MSNKKSSIFTGIQRKLRHSDWKLLVPYLILLGTGILMVYSSSSRPKLSFRERVETWRKKGYVAILLWVNLIIQNIF